VSPNFCTQETRNHVHDDILLSYLTKVAFLQIGISFFKWGSPIEEIMVGIMVQVLEQIQYTNIYYFELAFLHVFIFPRSRVQKLVWWLIKYSKSPILNYFAHSSQYITTLNRIFSVWLYVMLLPSYPAQYQFSIFCQLVLENMLENMLEFSFFQNDFFIS
jgi:hypothetical protein